jgi:chromate reductase, NAD(P)H dehydrogenase (quinone)
MLVVSVLRYRVLCLSGSLRQRSANSALLLAARKLAPDSLELEMYAGLGRLPLFNPDEDVDPPPMEVQLLRHAAGRSDALLIACPEYAHGIPGPLKNLLDWLVGSLEFPGKPVALLNASARGSHHAQQALREVLQTMSAELLDSASGVVPLPGAGCDVSLILDSDALRNALRERLDALANALARD